MALTDGLVGLWHMNNDWLDSSGKGNHGTAYGALFNPTGKLNQCGSFDGVDDYVNVGASPTLDVQNNEFSIGAWIKLPQIGLIDKPIFSNASQGNPYRGFALVINRRYGLSPNANIDLQKRGVIDQNISYSFTADIWYYIFATQHFSGGTPSEVKFYVNGAYLGNFLNVTPYYSSNGDPKHIGQNITGDTGFYKGLIDELALWNRALSAAEIQALWNNGNGLELGISQFKYPQIERRARGINRGILIGV